MVLAYRPLLPRPPLPPLGARSPYIQPGVPQGNQDLLSCPLIPKHIPDRTNPRVLPLTRTSDLQNFPRLKSLGPAPGLRETGTVARRCRTSSTCLPRPYGSSRKGRIRPQHVPTETDSTVRLWPFAHPLAPFRFACP